MFAGAQIITTKLVHRGKRKELVDAQNEEKTTKDLENMANSVPRSRAAIVVESRAEKLERKALAQERRHERLIEQQKIAQHMENLMEKVLRETPLSKKDEDNLRNKVKTIIDKVNKDSDKIISPSGEQSTLYSKPLKPTNQGAFLLWYDKHLN